MARKRKKKAVSAALLIGRVLVRLFAYAVLVIAAVTLAGRAYTFGYSVFHSSPVTAQPGKDVAVTITQEMSIRDIGDLLKRRSLIRDAQVFVVQAMIYGYKLYPGTYVLNTAQDVSEMIAIMSVKPEGQDEQTAAPALGGGA